MHATACQFKNYQFYGTITNGFYKTAQFWTKDELSNSEMNKAPALNMRVHKAIYIVDNYWVIRF